MKIQDIPEYLKTVKPWRSVLFLGPPGIGKSTMVRAFAEWEAKKLGLEFVDYDYTHYHDVVKEPDRYYVFYDLRLTEVEPTDLGGIPRDLNTTAITNKQYDWAIALSKAKAGLLLLDEFNLHQRDDVESQSYKLILDRKAGSIRFSQNVRVIALGNTKETNPLVRFLSFGLRNRFNILKVDSPTIEEWSRWMDENVPEWDKRGLAYLMKFRDDFLKPPMTEGDGEDNWASPRTWHWLLEELPETPERFWLEKAVGYLGQEVGNKFTSFLRNPVPDPEQLLKNPEKFYGLNLDSKYLAVVLVGNHFCEDKKVSTKDVIAFLRTAASEGGEYLALFTMTVTSNRAKAIKLLQEINTKKSYEDLRKEFSNLGWFIQRT